MATTFADTGSGNNSENQPTVSKLEGVDHPVKPPGRQDAMAMDLGARDAADTYFEHRDHGEEDQPAFEAALRAYRGHFPTIRNDAAIPLVAQSIAEACSERGKALQRSARARKAAKVRWSHTKNRARD